MTVNADSTRELDINRLVKLAIQTAGLLPAGAPASGVQWNNLSSQARDLLELHMDELPTLGSLARSAEMYDVVVTAGTLEYDLPATTMRVFGNAQFSATGETSSTFVRTITREEYLALPSKTVEGRPTLMYPQPHATISVLLWPVPVTGGTLTIQRDRMLADNDDGSKTVDAERFWHKAIMFELAHMVALANSMPLAKCGYLRSMAERSMASAKRAGTQPGPISVNVSHTSGWSK